MTDIAARQVRCFFGFHIFSKWVTTKDVPLKHWPESCFKDGVPTFEIVVGRSIEQERTCSECGLTQLRRETCE